MKLVVFTRPAFYAGEAADITHLLEHCGVARVHIRKPDADEADVEALIAAIDPRLRSRLTVHYFPTLAVRYGTGLQLNARVPEAPAGFGGMISRSCHSVAELTQDPSVAYSFLSPVGDSISKAGYKAAFTAAELEDAARRGIFNEHVYALGGVRQRDLARYRALGFGGAGLLGAVWNKFSLRDFSLQYITQGFTADEIVSGVAAALAGGCSWVQLRMKEATAADIISVGRQVRRMCIAAGAVFLVDDSIDLALELGADGVHLGKNDMPVAEARAAIGPAAIIGATANTAADIISAAQAGADYIGLGPLRFTTTKKNLSPTLGYEGYARIMAEVHSAGVKLPTVAIGGITPADIAPLAQAGVQGVAVSGAIAAAAEPAAAAREFVDILKHHYKYE